MEDKLIKIVEWTKLKLRIHSKSEIKFYFREREIWWASLGSNIGYEQDGKNRTFERPILILRRFNSNMLWALPLTSKEKLGKFFYTFEYEDKKFAVILTQLRMISSRRLIRKMRMFPNEDFKNVKDRVKKLI